MRIIGIGIDVVEIERVQRMLYQPESELLDAWFLPEEQADIAGNASRVAAGIAAKESVVKALGTGFQDDVCSVDIRIRRDESGQPHVELSNGALEAATGKKISQWFVSLSHSERFAVANAVAVADM